MDRELERHYSAVVRELTEGSVVPLLGAGVNLCDRPRDLQWKRGSDYLPNGRELAQYLATKFFYPIDEPEPAASGDDTSVPAADGDAAADEKPAWVPPLDLLRVSQYVASTDGAGPLYRELRNLFTEKYAAGRVHKFFADFSRRSRAQGTPTYQLIVTTNYDDALEKAFDGEEGEQPEPYDVVWYIADPEEERGKFWHRPFDGEPRKIGKPNEYKDLALDERTLILKIHGAVDRSEAEHDSFVITEDHYITYMTDIDRLLPPEILNRLRRSCFLFLGYSMADWNLRVILHRIWGGQPLSYKSWAVRPDADAVEEALWRKREVDVVPLYLEEYMSELERRMESLAVEAAS